MAYAQRAAGSLADLLTQARAAVKKVVNEADRTAGTVLADHDYFDNLLNTLPDAYQMLAAPGPLRRLLQLLSVRSRPEGER